MSRTARASDPTRSPHLTRPKPISPPLLTPAAAAVAPVAAPLLLALAEDDGT
jgi:hypothetical protein